jgi:hypothetical protein
MTEKKFLQETNFQEEDETTPEEKMLQLNVITSRRYNAERLWNDASLRNGEY